MAEVLKGATLVDLSPPHVERADLRVEGGKILERAPSLEPEPGELVTDLSGRFMFPGFVLAHTHLYCTLARGMPAPDQPTRSFLDILQNVWWKLDRAFDLPTVELSARAAAAEALHCGVTTVIDHHSSPNAVEGSLDAVRRGVESAGLRAVLCYDISDRNGKAVRDQTVRETERFLSCGQGGRFRGMVGCHASFTLDDDSLEMAVALARKHDVGLHLHVAESPDDDRDSRQRFDKGVIERLGDAGVLGPHSILVHCAHLSWQEFSQAQQSGAWLVHNPRSNMTHAVGYAPAGKFGARKAIGTDGIGADVLAEAQYAFFQSMEAGLPIDPVRWLAGGHQLASELFGLTVGRLEPDAAADLVVYDYPAVTPVTSENLAGHLSWGLNSNHVESVMVDGCWRLYRKQILSFDFRELCARTREASIGLWARMRES